MSIYTGTAQPRNRAISFNLAFGATTAALSMGTVVLSQAADLFPQKMSGSFLGINQLCFLGDFKGLTLKELVDILVHRFFGHFYVSTLNVKLDMRIWEGGGVMSDNFLAKHRDFLESLVTLS